MKKLFKILMLAVCLMAPAMVNAQETAEDYYQMGKELIASEDSDDIKTGLLCLILAAEEGHSQAQCLAGAILLLFEDEEMNEKAVKYLKMAAAQNNREAMELLSICYKNGTGVTASLQLASYWERKSRE